MSVSMNYVESEETHMAGTMVAESVAEVVSSDGVRVFREVLRRPECQAIMKGAPGAGQLELPAHVMVYRYSAELPASPQTSSQPTLAQRPWQLCVGTLGEPGSHTLSLGGFRIVPEDRERSSGFSPEREAIGLACGMEEKVYWSRLIRVGGPLGLKNIDRIVGGKCVLLPRADSRVGQPHDIEMLRFAIAALKDFEAHSGVYLTTGQDLGHGTLSDGRTSSLQFLHEHFHGSVVSDTSEPTAEGNLHTLLGMLRGAGIDPRKARFGLIGYGNIGRHLVRRLEETLGADVWSRLLIVEAVPTKRQELSGRGVRVFGLEQKAEFLSQTFDALVLNANGGSLDTSSVTTVLSNPSIQVICGCENLVMPNPEDSERLRASGKLYCPTELCGMMGYLNAVEEYLSRREGKKFQMQHILDAAKKLDEAAFRAARRALQMEPLTRPSFEEAIRAEYGG